MGTAPALYQRQEHGKMERHRKRLTATHCAARSPTQGWKP